jgi:hypothetical protein
MAGSTLRNLTMFESLCGKKNLKNVIFVTTMWDQVLEDVGKERERELRQNFFRPILERGAHMFAYDGRAESGWSIIDRFVDDRFATLLQEELVDLKKELCETDAGRQLYGILEKLVEQQRKTADAIRKELDSLNESKEESSELLMELQKDYEDLRVRLSKALEDMQKLDIPVVKRILRMLWLPRRVRGWNVTCEYLRLPIRSAFLIRL